MSIETSDDVLLHAGRKGMKWYQHIFGSRRAGVSGRRQKSRSQKAVAKAVVKRKKSMPVDEYQRELEVINLYRHRDKVSTKALKAKIARIESERKLKELAEAPGKARAEALKKKQQARLKFIGKAISAGIDVYSKIPSSVATKNINKSDTKAIEKAIKDFKTRQEWAKAFKDVPITMTNFTQSVNIRGVDIYVPESIQKSGVIKHYANNENRGNEMGENINGVYIPSNEDLLQHYGKKGMKWKKRKGVVADAAEALTEDLAYAADKRAIDEHVKDALRDKQTVERNMSDNISKIKSGVRNGKTENPAEQKYHDAYMRNAKAYEKVAKILEERRKHAKDTAAAHAKDVKNRRK